MNSFSGSSFGELDGISKDNSKDSMLNMDGFDDDDDEEQDDDNDDNFNILNNNNTYKQSDGDGSEPFKLEFTEKSNKVALNNKQLSILGNKKESSNENTKNDKQIKVKSGKESASDRQQSLNFGFDELSNKQDLLLGSFSKGFGEIEDFDDSKYSDSKVVKKEKSVVKK